MGYMNSQYRAVEPARIEKRKVYRHPVQLQRTAIRKAGYEAEKAELVDVSIYGCRISTDVFLKPDDRVWLRFMDCRPVAATAIWCENGHVGCRFDESMDHSLFRALTLITE